MVSHYPLVTKPPMNWTELNRAEVSDGVSCWPAMTVWCRPTALICSIQRTPIDKSILLSPASSIVLDCDLLLFFFQWLWYTTSILCAMNSVFWVFCTFLDFYFLFYYCQPECLGQELMSSRFLLLLFFGTLLKCKFMRISYTLGSHLPSTLP